MYKSAERQELEKKINRRFEKSYRKALFWLVVGFPVMLFAKKRFLKFMSRQIRKERLAWLEAIKELEELEKKEGFPAMRAYTGQLKELKNHLPEKLTRVGYYPFSGLDIYWGSVFNTLILEDKNFDTPDENHFSMWWDRETYSLEKCSEIENLLKQNGIIPSDAEIHYLKGDSDEDREDNNFNKEEVVLIHKAGHPFTHLLRKRFKGKEMDFGAIIIASDPASRRSLDALLNPRGYKCVFYSRGKEFLVPFALTLRNAYLYVKESRSGR